MTPDPYIRGAKLNIARAAEHDIINRVAMLEQQVLKYAALSDTLLQSWRESWREAHPKPDRWSPR